MNDFISRQAAIDEIECVPFDDYGDYERAREIIVRMPSLKAADIIRCENCKYCDFGIDEDDRPFFKCLHGRSYGETRPYDYCSWGERSGSYMKEDT